MAKVGLKANILKVSPKLKKTLMSVGILESHPSKQPLFHVDQETTGVFLVVKGRVSLSLPELPKLDRVFTPGSILGLPATFTGHAYSLDATTVTASDVMHIERQSFLDLMSANPEFCREVADILSREVSFIQGALAERRRLLRTHAGVKMKGTALAMP